MGLIKDITVRGRQYHLAYTVKCMVEVEDFLCQSGDKQDLIEVLSNPVEHFELFCKILTEMAKAGEILNRIENLEKGEVPKNENIMLYGLMPSEIPMVSLAALDALVAGMNREHEEEEIDLGLAELEKKEKGPGAK